MTKTLWIVSSKKFHLNANKGFVIFLISKLITCFIGGFTLTMKPQSIAHSLNGSEHIYIYWILYLEGEVHLIWDLWVSGLQECKSNEFFWNRACGQQLSVGSKKFLFFWTGDCICPILTLRKVREGELNVLPHSTWNSMWPKGQLLFELIQDPEQVIRDELASNLQGVKFSCWVDKRYDTHGRSLSLSNTKGMLHESH